MFKLEGIPSVDPAEEQRKMKEIVKQNVFSFFFLCAAIRVCMYLQDKFS